MKFNKKSFAFIFLNDFGHQFSIFLFFNQNSEFCGEATVAQESTNQIKEIRN